jgi:hypothetical protein
MILIDSHRPIFLFGNRRAAAMLTSCCSLPRPSSAFTACT